MTTEPSPTTVEDISEVAVLGCGTMGSGIAWLAARAGMNVRVIDVSAEVTATRLEALRRRVDSAVESGLEDPSVAARTEALVAADSLEDAVRGAHLVIEAVSEDLVVKHDVLAAAQHAGPGAIIATNTSSFPIETLASSLADPSRFLGVHFFNPADLIPGVEVITHAGTREDVVERVIDLLESWGKAPARVKSSPGFIGNRLQFALFKEAVACVEEGLATPDAIDTVVRSTFGFRLPAYGPFEIADMAGLDVYVNIFATLRDGLGAQFDAPSLLLDTVEEGRLGLKSGGGFRDYPPEIAEQMIMERDHRYQAIDRAVRGTTDDAGVG